MEQVPAGKLSEQLDRYGNIGIEYDWVVDYFSKGDNFWEDNGLGINKIKNMKSFLSDAGATVPKKNTMSPFGKKIADIGIGTEAAWGLLVSNLVYTSEFIKEFIPKKEDRKSIMNRVVSYQEQVRFLAKISVNIDIRTQALSFALPDFGLSFRDTVIPREVWENCSDALLKAEENWGIVELGYQFPETDNGAGKIKLTGFQDFCPYVVDLDEFRYAREEFSLDEWTDIVLGAIDYNPDGYETPQQKLAMITRLLPFVEKRLNMIELAPKGTGKSYLFGSVSRFGWLSSGGTMSRARMFYDISRRQEGLVFGHDYVALTRCRP